MQCKVVLALRASWVALKRLVLVPLPMAAVRIGEIGVDEKIVVDMAGANVVLARLVLNMAAVQIGGAGVDGRRAPRWPLLAGSLHSSLCWGPSRPSYLQVIRLRSHIPRYFAVLQSFQGIYWNRPTLFLLSSYLATSSLSRQLAYDRQ